MRRPTRRAICALGALCAAFLVALPVQLAHADACAPVINPVACENTKPGTSPSVWDIAGSGDPSIQGFATDISTNVGGTVQFKIATPATSYRIDIYRLGYYAGLGARKIASVTPTLRPNQPACLSNTSTGLVDCGNWAVSASWTIPAGTVSGVFFAHLVRTDGQGGESHIPFVVRDDSSHSDLDFQTSDTTWQAYNQYGGNSLYVGSPAGRAYKVSYNRPITTRGTGAEDYVFNAEFPMIRFLEANGYDVSYTTGVDSDRRGALIKNHRAFLSVGHDEYWSGPQRTNVEAARDAGVNLAFFSGNAVFWKTRYEPSIDGSNTANRTLVTYKETHANAVIDPQDPPTWTGTWRDARFSPPADGGRPENGLSGTLFMVTGGPTRKDSIKVPAANGKMRFWRGTAVATQAAGATATMPAGTLGYEWDSDLDNGFRPAGVIRMSDATYSIASDLLLDNGSSYGSGSANHALTLYRAASGALVFGAGSVQWSWGLDASHDNSGTATDASMRQATVNLLADMGVQPGTLVSGLTTATKSTDLTAPNSVITSPAAGATVPAGTAVTIVGTASDVGGQVGGVEVSVNGGATWRRATGRASWTYSWTPSSGASATLRSRAVDDSGNLETPSAGVTVNTSGGGGGGTTCPCTIFGTSTPVNPNDPDTSATELGVKFRASTAGSITGIRFYKGANNTGTHTGSLWTTTGARLATATFAGETASGWQQVSFASPVAITAGTTYIASYYTPNGHYADDNGVFSSAGVTSGPLTALQNGVDGPNSVFNSGAGFPTGTWMAANYWVDVVFGTSTGGTDTTPPTVTTRSPSTNATGVSTGTTVSASFSEPVQPATVAFTLTGPSGSVASTLTVNAAATTATLTPSAALTAGATYTASVSGAKDPTGNTMAATTWSFTTAPASGACPCSLWTNSTTPTVLADPDTSSVEVGVKVTPNRAGSLTAVRFYKAATNTGTHVVRVWSATGTLLSSATATSETASGWQTVPLPSALALTAGATYVVSYRAPVGRYSVDSNYFAVALTSGPLTAPAGSNGVYSYGASGTFPASTYQASNYWVDVVFS